MTEDECEIRAIITECYAMISGPAGPRDWARQDAIFHPDCIQMRTNVDENGRSQITRMTLDEYEKNAAPLLMKMDFYEVELVNRIDIFGNIAQAWGSYIAKSAPEDTEAERRGINAFQFFKDDGGDWKIISMIWDNERAGLELPADMVG